MKRKFNILILVVIMLILNIQTTNAATYNGSGADSSGKGGGTCFTNGATGDFCIWNNNNYAAIRVTVIKYKTKTGERTRVGNSHYYSNKAKTGVYPQINSVYSIGIAQGSSYNERTASRMSYSQTWYASGNTIDASKMKKALTGTEEVTDQAFKLFKNAFSDTNNPTSSQKEALKSKAKLTEFLNDEYADGYEYRIVIEPIISVMDKSGNVYYYTAKGLGNYAQNNKSKVKANSNIVLTNEGRWCEVANKLFLESSDIGITKPSTAPLATSNNRCAYDASKQLARETLADYKNGRGYNILKFVSTIVPTKKCDYNNSKHFKKNVNGEVKPTDTKGSGPNGENCCNLDMTPSKTKEKIIDTYKKQYKDEVKKSISTNDFKTFFYIEHPECLESKPKPVVEKANCSLKQTEAEYDQGADGYALLADVGKDKGLVDIEGTGNRYRREILDGYGSQILCSETVKLSLPQGYKNTLYRGQKFEWPTFETGIRPNSYPLALEGKATCKAVIAYSNIYNTLGYNSCSQYSCQWIPNWSAINAVINSDKAKIMDWKTNAEKHYDLNGNFYVSYTDKKYGQTFKLERYYNGHTSYEFTGFSLNNYGGDFTIKQTTKYKIPSNVYRYTKKDGSGYSTAVSSLPSSTKNFVDVGYGNLPIDNNAAKGKYSVTISYNSIGGFPTNKFATTPTAYTCPYEVDTPLDECNCQSNTAAAGKDISACLVGGCDGKMYTCSAAQEKFCSTPVCQCPSYETKTSEAVSKKLGKYAGKDLTSYVYAGMSCSAAQEKYCGTPLKECPAGTTFEHQPLLTDKCYSNANCRLLTCNVYTCPNNTASPGKKLNTLISNYIARKGGSINDTLLNKAYNLFCKDDIIIYRVIDLNNPFPGKSGKGRDAGFNWSDSKVVSKYITNNRGVKTNKIYNKDNVMYHFTLTPSNIKAIRSYNRSNSYSDFKLSCKDSNGRNCVSNFVHNPNYGLMTDSRCYSSSKISTCQ